MNTRTLLVVVLLASAMCRAGEQASPSRDASVTVDAVVERPELVVGPLQVVGWNTVPDLGRDDFEILSDGTPVPVKSFSASQAPVSLVVLVDVSASLEIQVPWLQEPVQKFLIPALKPGDRVSFGRFGGAGVHVDSRFATDPREMKTAARSTLTRPRRQAEAPVRSDPSIQVQGINGAFGLAASPAWDAVDAAVTALEGQPGLRAIVLVSDGRSNGNVHGLEEVIVRAAIAGVSISVADESREVVIRQSGTRLARVRPAAFLTAMADVTGGAYGDVFGPTIPVATEKRPMRSDEDAVKRWLGRMLARFVDDLHATYALAFVPPVLDGRVHRVEVRVTKPGLRVRARQRYLAPAR